ncbi:hypothetical protein [Pedobacter sp. SYSU D00535]|uniref:hypothetical protein n=1 Tax=Pedobacter sp. SYSU D00535 TaxID=2810308 RepID=UPI001F61229C|nr:hypothetical protein [Pedobacter sp. SYSU D00535]
MMRFPVICVPFLPMAGMALFPFILIKRSEYKGDQVLLNHERIHIVQQLELLLVGFYLLYFLNYLINLLKYKKHELAYLNIVFEKEAYRRESETSYLKRREIWAWRRFLSF